MNKLLIITLMLSISTVHALEIKVTPNHDIVIPAASLAHAKTKAVIKIKIANETPLLVKVVAEAIKTAADEGESVAMVEVSTFTTVAVHNVAVQLRAKDYYVKLENGILGLRWLAISW